MGNFILIGIFLSNLVLLAVLWSSFKRFRLIEAELRQKLTGYEDQVRGFLSPLGEGPSPFAQVIDNFCGMLARAVLAQAKTFFMSQRSAEVRSEKALEGDIALDSAGQIPWLATLLSSFPQLSKTLRRNPALLDLALSKLSSRMEKSGAAEHSGNGSSQAKFKLGV